MSVRNVDKYLDAVVRDCRDDFAAGFANDYEARQRLWKSSVVIWEVADDPEPWLDELRQIALDTIRATQIESTIRSAERKAADHAR